MNSLNKKSLNCQNMFIIYVIDFSTKKKKCKDGGSNFLKNQKYRLLEIEKKIFFHLFYFRKS